MHRSAESFERNAARSRPARFTHAAILAGTNDLRFGESADAVVSSCVSFTLPSAEAPVESEVKEETGLAVRRLRLG